MPDAASPQITYASVPLADLHPWPGNARRGNIPLIKRSLIRFGQYRSVSVQSSTMRVMAGNNTVAAARELGWTHLNVELVDVPDAIGEEINVLDNRANDLAVYDLASQLAQIEALADPAEVGYTPDDIAGLLRALEKETGRPKPQNDPDDSPPLLAGTPVSQPGQLWTCGPHRLLVGDSLVSASWHRLLGTDRPTMVWTDPPYGVAYVGKTKDALTIENDTLDSGQLQDFIRTVFTVAVAHCEPGAAVYVAAPAGPLFADFGLPLRDLGIWRQTLVWAKDVFVMGRSDYHYRHEALFYGWMPGAAHHAPPDRKQDTIWEVPRPKRNAEHPTMKPVDLIVRAINNSSDEGALVVDPFGGSGSTMIAAERTGRRAALIELDPAYCDVILRRYAEHTGVVPVSDTGESFPVPLA